MTWKRDGFNDTPVRPRYILSMTTPSLSAPGWTCLWPVGAELGEGPVWDVARQCLWFVDIEGKRLHRYDPATGGRASIAVPMRVTAVAPARGDRLIAATEHGFAWIDPATGAVDPIHNPEAHLPENRFNDGKLDPAGRFWAGTMDDTKRTAQGSLYRLDADLRVTCHQTDYRITNGPAFSPDGRTMYESDTLRRVTYALDLTADGTLSNRKVWMKWPVSFGNPDGMTTDSAGNLWIAFWGGSCLRKLSAEGAVLAEFALPVSNVTSAAFAGPELDRLFVTTARQALTADELETQPLAGGLFEIIGHGVTGRPAGVFVG